MQLEKITERIESFFGEAPPLSAAALSMQDVAVLDRVLGDDCYQDYLQDQHNRQVIRDYLTNAVMLGILDVERLAVFADQVATTEGRGALSLKMLMSSIEEADKLASGGGLGTLELLRPTPESPPYIKLVP